MVFSFRQDLSLAYCRHLNSPIEKKVYFTLVSLLSQSKFLVATRANFRLCRFKLYVSPFVRKLGHSDQQFMNFAFLSLDETTHYTQFLVNFVTVTKKFSKLVFLSFVYLMLE